MPAKAKYLTTPGQRALKISAGVIGGFMLTSAFHLIFGAFAKNKEAVLATSAFTSFLVWAGLLVLVFWFKTGWRAWATYLGLTAVCATIVYLGLQTGSL